MLRGVCKFRCDECNNTFTAPDIEYAATAYSYPQKCPKCGSRHTWPQGIMGRFDPQRLLYMKIWEKIDRA